MIFWKFQEVTFEFFGKIFDFYRGGFSGKGVKKQRGGQMPENLKKQIESQQDMQFPGKQEVLNNPPGKNKLKVYFQGEVYEVDLEDVKEIPAGKQPQEYIEENKEEVFEHAFEKYQKFVNDDMEYVGLFLHGNRVFGANEETVRQGLQECLEFFTEIEDYETASDVRDTIEKLEYNHE